MFFNENKSKIESYEKNVRILAFEIYNLQGHNLELSLQNKSLFDSNKKLIQEAEHLRSSLNKKPDISDFESNLKGLINTSSNDKDKYKSSGMLFWFF